MEKIDKIIQQLGLKVNLTLAEIPNIDLYMDQVIQLFENKYNETKRTDDEKILTKTMINNYSKGKLLFPISNKKYSKEHLILISLIYQLKGALSLNDIKVTLEGINKIVTEENNNLDAFYQSYLNLSTKNVADFKEDISKKVAAVNEEVTKMGEVHEKDFERVVTIASVVHMSNLYRRLAEKLVDELAVEKEMEKK